MTNKQLPNNWTVINLRKVVSPTKGKKPIRLENSSFAESVPYIDIKALELNQINQYADIKSSKLFSEGDIAIVWDGARSGWVAKAHNGAIGSTLCALTPVKIDSTYLYYYLFSKYSLINSKPRGVGIPHVDPKFLWSLEIPLPPTAEQKRIADKLDTLFGQLTTIQKVLKRIPELIKNFRQQVLTSAVSGKLTEEWRKGKALDKWENKSIGSLFKVQTGSTPHRENNAYYDFGKIPWIKSGEVKNTLIFNSNEYITELAIQETNAKIYPINTILIAMYGEGKTRGQVGLLKIPAASNQAVAALVNDKGYDVITIKYVFFFCLSQYNNIRNQAQGGNQPNLNLTTIKKWEIPLPPQKEQEEIVRIIDSIFKKLETIEQRYNVLKTKIEKLPQILLNKAFSGELVDHFPSDGNAEDLLKEIELLKRSTKKK